MEEPKRTPEGLPSRWVLIIYGVVAIGGDVALALLVHDWGWSLPARQLAAAFTTLTGVALVALYATRQGTSLRACWWRPLRTIEVAELVLVAVVAWGTLWAVRAAIGDPGPSPVARAPEVWATLLLWKVAVTAPSEELVWRGLILRRWIARWGPGVGVIGTSLLFALPHSTPISAFVTGLILALSYLHFRTLWAPILLHVVVNSVAVLYGRSTPPEAVAIGVVVVGVPTLGCWALWRARGIRWDAPREIR